MAMFFNKMRFSHMSHGRDYFLRSDGVLFLAYQFENY